MARSQEGFGPGIFTLFLLLSFLLVSSALSGDQLSLVSSPHGGLSAVCGISAPELTIIAAATQRLSQFQT